ncbi:hypothetical protein FRC16_006963 [Serendipita sp. 398]|nr:hypothetical protein FRC16_006963 [Serendipita sp. 398]
MTTPVQSTERGMNGEANRKRLEYLIGNMSTQQLVQIFEPAIRQALRYRHPKADIDRLTANLGKETSRQQLLELASLLPHVMDSIALEGTNSTPEVDRSSRASLETMRSQNDHASTAENAESIPPLKQAESSIELANTIPENSTSQPTHIGVPKVDKTVIQGLYLLGRGKFKTSTREFDITPEDATKAAAWSDRRQKFDPSGEYLVYHFKVLRAEDIRSSLKSLANQGIVAPRALDIEPEDEIAIKALDDYERTVAEALYALPTFWPPEDHFLAIMSEESHLNLHELPSENMHAPNEYIDISNLIKPDRNSLTIIEEEDMQYYAFCLFEKRPGADQLRELTQ